MMFWITQKLERRIQELADLRYRDRQTLEQWLFAVDHEAKNGIRPPVNREDKTVRLGERWHGRDLYVWLSKRISIPSAWQGKKVVGLFDFGKTGGGHNSGFESLLYVNGLSYQGVDSNHKEVFLPENLIGTDADFCFRLWSGLEGGGKQKEQEHEFKYASLAWLDEAADDLYYTAKAALDTSKLLPEEQFERQFLLKALDRAFLQVDWSQPGSVSFYESVQAAQSTLREELSKLPKHHEVKVTCVGHTHIDVAWLWRLTHTREKAARSFSTVLRLMEQYPDYVFLQTQPQLYAYIKSDYPDIYEQIRERVLEGRWEVGGAMWLEADCNLTSGESLVRQIMYGKRFFQQEFGVDCDYLWLPDVFGYSWALPQILQKSGIRTFMTTKISWNQYNRMPHDTFMWRGIDGTEVLTHFITTPEVPEHGVWWYSYNGLIAPFQVKGIWDNYRDKSVNQELLMSYGYGDGGGGVNRDMLESRRRLADMPGMPQVVTGRADEFFSRLHETVEKTDQYVHTWDGELYLEYHRGTYTSQAHNKKMNRKLELLYRDAEWLQSLAAVHNTEWTAYPSEKLHEGWTILLRNQFHDIIPGSSIHEVYEDSRLEYEEANHIGTNACTQAMTSLIRESSNAWTVWNNSACERTETMEIPLNDGNQAGCWTDVNGQILQAEYLGGRWIVKVHIPALSGITLRFITDSNAMRTNVCVDSPMLVVEGNMLRTPYYFIHWNEDGQLTRIYDRENDREVLAKGTCGNVFQVFEDKPMAYDAWDIDLYYQQKMKEITSLLTVQVTMCGNLRAVIQFEWSYMDSVVEQQLIVYTDCRRIDFVTQVDWQERNQLLKVAFPVAVRSTEATYDIQFGNVKRPTHWNTSWDAARFETVGHQWADLSERGYGVSLLNDCKYGYDIKDNVMRLTLLKSAVYPDPLADAGHHQFTYSLLPHLGDWFEGSTAKEAWNLNNPLRLTKGELHPEIESKSLFVLSVAHVAIDAIKKAEDSDAIILRIHEFTGQRSFIRISSEYAFKSWQECDLMEQPLDEAIQGASMEFEIKPYEIKTLLIHTSFIN